MTTLTGKTLDENLVSIDKNLKRVTASLIIERDDSVIARLLSLRETLATVVDQVKKELPNNAERKNLLTGLSIMHNNTASVIDLALEKELSSESATEFIVKNQKRILKVSTLISSLRKVNAKNSRVAETEVANEDGLDQHEVFDKQNLEIKSYQHYRDMLPKTNREVDKNFILRRVPIVFKAKPNVSAYDLKKAGFSTPSIKVSDLGYGSRAVGIGHSLQNESHVIFENQLVLGLNTRKLTDEKKKVKEFRKAVIKILSAKHHKQFIEMSSMHTGLGNSGFVYTWLMEESEYNRIVNVTKKRFAVVEWGFAFKD